MPKNIKLLLTENVEALGIVGDVVNVRTGFARNFLLPRNMATQPSEEKIQALAAKRADAQRLLAEQRRERESLIGKLQNIELTLIRSCNDQGVLYGSITQQDVSAALNELGHAVKPRDVRITQVMKRVDKYEVHIKLDSDLDATIRVIVQADRKLETDRHEHEDRHAQPQGAAPADAAEGAEAHAKPEAPAKTADAPEGEKKAKAPKKDKPAKAAATEAPAEKKTGWGKVVDKPVDLIPPPRARRGRDR
ncbi:MAG: 50S ribosomal protein L9 [Phycisphaeraceae bacterium]|nr:MAG: 50S ribosomal protein L9 [Phycisphaeraceae bacterium]